MQEQLTIRKTCSADALHISELVCKAAHCFNSSGSSEVAPWFLASITPSAIASHIADTKFNYLVGFMGRVLVGVIAIRDTTHVYHLFVAPEFRRQGVAAKLWEHAKKGAIALGTKGCFSVRSSEHAVPVYEPLVFMLPGIVQKKKVLYLSQ